MSYSLISQVNESVHEEEQHLQLVQEVLSYFDGAMTSLEEFDALLEMRGGSDAAMGRAAELDWLQGMKQDQADRESGTKRYGANPLGLDRPMAQPKPGHYVLTPRGVGSVVDMEGDNIMVEVRGQDIMIKRGELLDEPKDVRGKVAWMMKRA